MTQKTRTQHGETVRAIWNRDLTCLAEEIVQEKTACECEKCLGGSIDCLEWAWPVFDDPVLVSGDGRPHLCPICVRDIDAPFVDAYWDAVSKVAEMEDLVAHFPPELGVIERGRREDWPPHFEYERRSSGGATQDHWRN